MIAHGAYAFLRPHTRVRPAPKRGPVHLARVLAVIQFEAVLIWVWSVRPHGLCLDLSTVQLWQWMAFLLLFTMGQKLNVGIYQAIGIPGKHGTHHAIDEHCS